MADSRITTLKEVARDLGLSYKAAWSAAQRGRLPAVQPFGRGTSWLVASNYRDFLPKAEGHPVDDDGNDTANDYKNG